MPTKKPNTKLKTNKQKKTALKAHQNTNTQKLNEQPPFNWHKGMMDAQIELINLMRLIIWANQSKIVSMPASCVNKMYLKPQVFFNTNGKEGLTLDNLLTLCQDQAKKLVNDDIRQVLFIVLGKFYKHPTKQFQKFIDKYQKKIKITKKQKIKKIISNSMKAVNKVADDIKTNYFSEKGAVRILKK